MLREWISRVRGTVMRRRLELEFSQEIESHIGLMADDLVRRGMPPAEARREARRQFGGVAQIQELHREGRSLTALEHAAADVRYALRMMRRNPGFTLVAVLTLALGIGVNTTLFSAYNSVALKPLPVADPERVVRLERWFASRNQGTIQYAFSYPEYVYLRDHTSSFAGLTASSWYLRAAGEWRGGKAADRLQGQLVSANYFAVMGVGARLGRTFVSEEDGAPGGNPVIVLSAAAWERRFQSDPGIVGQIVRLNGTAFTVIGVTWEDFTGAALETATPDFWAPLSMQAQIAPGRNWLADAGNARFQLLGRMKSGVAMARAQAEADLVLGQFAAAHPERDKTLRLTLQHTSFFGNTEDPRFQAAVAGVMLVVGLVLLVAGANIANMLLARGAERQREIGMRLALGASRGRIIRQLLTESVTLGIAGGAAGLLLSIWSSSLLRVVLESIVFGPFGGAAKLAVDLRADGRVYAYALALSVATGILFGLSPALRFTRPNLVEGGRKKSRTRSLLLGAQVAISMLLLITTGLLVRGMSRSRIADPGFATRGLYMLAADFGNDPAIANERQRRLLEHLALVPGVAAAATGGVPMTGTWTPPIETGEQRGRTLASVASETYLETMGVPLVRGRNFSHAEAAHSAPVAVISEGAARSFWPGRDPIGQRFRLDLTFRGTWTEFEVIGIAKDVRYANATRLDPAHVYLTAKPRDFEQALLRVRGDDAAAMAAIRREVGKDDRDLLPSLVLISIEGGPLRLQKLQARVCAGFAGLLASIALLLAGVGIYGVMAYLVSQRTKEIGVRMALGAAAGDVVRDVVVSGLRPVAIGMAVGMAGAGALSAVLHSTLVFPGSPDLLYGVSAYDPATFGGLALFLLLVAGLASALPARRAVRVDPMEALRYE
jgi:predicted permease